ncbi:MAG TPA: hypothetical protein VF831_10815 [Anaerolineales bacterium]
MDQNSNAYLNRIEIIFYSLLISCMNIVRRVQLISDPIESPSQQSLVEENFSFTNKVLPNQSLDNWWTRLQQAFITLIIWMVLGFAAGYLIGMIIPG